MDKLIKVSNPVQGVAVGQVATWDCPIGERIHALILEASATSGAGVPVTRDDVFGLITLSIDGKPQRTMLGSELDAINLKYGGTQLQALAANTTGAGNTLAGVYSGSSLQAPQNASQGSVFLPIFFAEPWRKSYSAREYRALPTAWEDGSVLKSLQLSIACPNTGNIASGYAMRVHTITDSQLGKVDKTSKQPVRLMNKWYRQQIPYTAAGDLPIVNLIKTASGRLAAVDAQTFFCQSGDDIQRIIVEADSRKVRDTIKLVNDLALLYNEYNSALNTGNKDRFDLDYDYSDLPTDGLILASANGAVNTHKVTATLSAAAAGSKVITCISEVYGPID